MVVVVVVGRGRGGGREEGVGDKGDGDVKIIIGWTWTAALKLELEAGDGGRTGGWESGMGKMACVGRDGDVCARSKIGIAGVVLAARWGERTADCETDDSCESCVSMEVWRYDGVMVWRGMEGYGSMGVWAMGYIIKLSRVGAKGN